MNIIQIIGLGIAGIDPVGAILLFSAIYSGAGRSKIIALTVSAFVATVAAGVMITLASSQLVAVADFESGAIWAYLEIGVAILIGYWLIRGSKSDHGFEKKKEKQQSLGETIPAYIFTGVVFAATAVIDPTFFATAVVIADTNDVFVSIIAFTIWTLISQFMLFGLFAAHLLGLDQRLINVTMGLWERHKPLLQGLLYVAGIFVGLLLLADASYYIINGSYFSW